MLDTTERQLKSKRRRKTSSISEVNSYVSYVLLVLIILSPLPLGSNRPVLWALGAALMSGIAAIYFVQLQSLGAQLRYGFNRLTVPLVIAIIYIVGLTAQIIPFGTWFAPFEVQTLTGNSFYSDTLSLTPGATQLAILRNIGYGILFFLMLQVSVNRGRARKMVEVLFFAVVAYACYGLLALFQLEDSILFFEKWAYYGSATGPFVNRNSFATFLSMGLVIGTGLLIGRISSGSGKSNLSSATNSSAMHGYLMMLCCIIVLAAILQTDSRMGLFAGIVGTSATAFLILTRRAELGLKGWLLSFFGVLLVGLVLLYAFGQSLIERVGSLERSAAVRGDLYVQIIDMIKDRPITGYGADSFEVVYRAYRDFPVTPELIWDRAHSTYLALWMENGIILGSLPMLLVVIALFVCLRAVITRREDIVMPAIGVGVITTGAIHSTVDFSLEMQANVWFFVALVAIALSSAEKSKNS